MPVQTERQFTSGFETLPFIWHACSKVGAHSNTSTAVNKLGDRAPLPCLLSCESCNDLACAQCSKKPPPKDKVLKKGTALQKDRKKVCDASHALNKAYDKSDKTVCKILKTLRLQNVLFEDDPTSDLDPPLQRPKKLTSTVQFTLDETVHTEHSTKAVLLAVSSWYDSTNTSACRSRLHCR